jgi:hypothetical protein
MSFAHIEGSHGQGRRRISYLGLEHATNLLSVMIPRLANKVLLRGSPWIRCIDEGLWVGVQG